MVNDLAQLHMPIPDDVDKRFRKKVMQKYGLKKGNLQKAIIEALEQWGQTPVESLKTPENEYDLIKTFRPSHKNDPSKGGVLGAPQDFIGWECGITKIKKVE